MASDLLHIGASGVRAARAALDQTAQNIANAGTQGYVRRTVAVGETVASGGIGQTGGASLAGVRVTGTQRHADLFGQTELRRAGADAARAAAELTGLERAEAAIDQARPYEATVAFEGALRRLASDPVSGSERAAVIGAAEALAGAFNLAAAGLHAAAEGTLQAARAGTDAVNGFAAELAALNVSLARTARGSAEGASLLDRRDALLNRLSEQANLTCSFGANGQVEARLGGADGPLLVSGGAAAALTLAASPDGSFAFTIGGEPVTPRSGALAGHAAAAEAICSARSGLDASANALAQTVNAAQASGVDVGGNTGRPLFSGSGASTLAIAFADGAGLATAPAGAGPRSRDGTNLDLLVDALETGGVAHGVSDLLYAVSARVSQTRDMSEALQTIADGARAAVDRQSGVDLDTEAADLLRFQQAFQASGRAMQVASDVIDTLLGIGR